MAKQRTIKELVAAIKATTTKAETAEAAGLSEVTKVAKKLHALAVQASDDADQCWIRLGRALALAKETLRTQLSAKKPSWSAYVEEHFSFRQSRADQLIRIATGTATIKEERASTAARVMKHSKRKKKSALANAGSKPAQDSKSRTHEPRKHDACDEIDYPKVDGNRSDQALFNFRYLASEAKDCAKRAAVEIKPAHTVPAKIIQTARDVASAWSALADELERQTKGAKSYVNGQKEEASPAA